MVLISSIAYVESTTAKPQTIPNNFNEWNSLKFKGAPKWRFREKNYHINTRVHRKMPQFQKITCHKSNNYKFIRVTDEAEKVIRERMLCVNRKYNKASHNFFHGNEETPRNQVVNGRKIILRKNWTLTQAAANNEPTTNRTTRYSVLHWMTEKWKWKRNEASRRGRERQKITNRRRRRK